MNDLQKLRADYLAYDPHCTKIPLTQDPSTGSKNIWLSDLGSCPRKVMLRLTDAKQRDLWPSEVVRFAVGNFLHDLTHRALIYAEKMVSYEQRLDCPEGLSGRYDDLWDDDGTLTLTDVKSVRSNQFRRGELAEKPPRAKEYNLPQMGGYILFGPHADRYDFDYIDAAGAHGALRVPVDPQHCAAIARTEIDVLQAARAALPELPPPLPTVLKESWTREKVKRLASLSEARDWRCNPLYCRYSGVSCNPLGPDEDVMLVELDRKTGRYSPTEAGRSRWDWLEEELAKRT